MAQWPVRRPLSTGAPNKPDMRDGSGTRETAPIGRRGPLPHWKSSGRDKPVFSSQELKEIKTILPISLMPDLLLDVSVIKAMLDNRSWT